MIDINSSPDTQNSNIKKLKFKDEEMFNYDGHIRYFLTSCEILPYHYTALDAQRLTVIYFSVIALDILNQLHRVDKNRIIDYIYHLQLNPKNDEEIQSGKFGFVGGTFAHFQGEYSESKYQQGHLAMIYTALCTLITLGDDLSRVNKEAIAKGTYHIVKS